MYFKAIQDSLVLEISVLLLKPNECQMSFIC